MKYKSHHKLAAIFFAILQSCSHATSQKDSFPETLLEQQNSLQTLLSQHRQQEAIEQLRRMINEYPNQFFLTQNLGVLLCQTTAYKEGLELLKKATKTPHTMHSFLKHNIQHCQSKAHTP